MLQLPNGCSASTLSVFPKNWQSGGAALLQINWRIQYYFRDPAFPAMKYGKLIIVKGMNTFKTLTERRDATRLALQNELRALKEEGYNPITKKCIPPTDLPDITIIDPDTQFTTAFRKALERLSITHETRIDIRSVINAVEKAARQLGIYNTPISQVNRRHIKNLLDQCGRNSEKFSNGRYNAYRSYLMMLFRELVELEAAPANPMHDISKKFVTKKIRTVLSNQQRTAIDKHLSETNPRFRQFVHLFFHSGGRMQELRQLKPSMVNLEKQTYRCIIKKRKHTEIERTIKSIAIPFWQYFLANCPNDHYLFGLYFKPSNMPISRSMASRYWQYYVKQDLGIDVNFYSLKHLNSSEVVDALDEKAAARLNGHTSTEMITAVYDVKQRSRYHSRLKDLGNSFV